MSLRFCSLFVPVVCLATLGGCGKKKVAPVSNEITSPRAELILREAVATVLSPQGIEYALIGEIERRGRRAAVVWPAIKDDKVIDDDIVAFVFEKDGAGWKHLVDVGLTRSGARAKLDEALGGPDEQVVHRSCGLPPERIAAHVKSAVADFERELKGKNTALAIAAYERLVQAFDADQAFFDDMLSELAIKGTGPFTQAKWFCKAKGCTLEYSPSEESKRSVTFPLGDCGGGKVLVKALPAE